MKLNKKDEAELMKVYNAWWHSYLNGDIKTYDFYLDDDYRFVGSTGSEEFLNRKDTTAFFEATAEQLAGNAKLENIIQTIETLEGMVLITDLADTFVRSGSEWVYYARFRFTSLLRKTKNGWRFFYQHFSTPDLKAQEGETIGLEKVTAENLELRSAIKRRTAELELKNRELEVEAALERIRAQVTAMSQSSDLLDIVVTMRTEFVKLGHAAHYFWHMRWLPEKYEKAMTSGDGTRIGFVMQLPRHIHGDIPLLANWEKSKESTVVYTMNVEEAISYVDKMVNLGDFQSIDPQAPTHDDIRHIKGLTFIMARTTHGEIGYSLPGVVKNPPKEDLDILVRFASAFDLAHKRFEDLRKSERQARETKIELGLERVRARAMGMQNSTELSDLVDTVFKELAILDFALQACIINLIDIENLCNTVWMKSPDVGNVPDSYLMKFEDYPFHDAMKEGYLKRDAKFIYTIQGTEKKKYDKYLFKDTEFRKISEEAQDSFTSLEKYVCSFTFSNFGGLQTIGQEPLSDENLDILARFGKVFDLTYTRFNDLKLAEAQARESRIELALERVRARTMAMQQSEELGDVATVLFKELNELVENLWTCGFVLCEKDRKEDEWWLSTLEGFIPAFYLPNIGDATHHNIYNGWINGESYHTEQLEGKSLQEHYDWLMTIPAAKEIFDDMLASGLERPTWQKLHCAYFSYGYLVMITQVPCPEEEIFKRFAKVFDQTYTRFLDLQKAEAQAREAQVEAALERVRSRTMAMQRSEELLDVASVLFQQVKSLGVPQWNCGFNIWNIGDKEFTYYPGSPDGIISPSPCKISLTEHPIFRRFDESRKRGDKLLVYEKEGEIQEDHYNYMLSLPEVGTLLQSMLDAGYQLPAFQIDHLANFAYGNLIFITYEHFPEMHDVFIRFAKVFEQTYTRFLDLQKAEAQVKEAQIEAALERIRSRSMAMHKPDELQEVVSLVAEKLQDLGVILDANGVIICTYFKDSKDVMHWLSAPDFSHSGNYLLPYFDHPIFKDAWESKNSGDDYFSKAYSKQEKDTFYEYAFKNSDYKSFPDEFKQWVFQNDKHSLSFAWAKNSAILVPSHTGVFPSDNDQEILKRFVKVFEQAYIRFLDLQKAEAQAREARIEAALERVRSRSMAMHQSDELKDVIKVIFDQMAHLNINAEHAGIIVDYEPKKDWYFWVADKQDIPAKITVPYLDLVWDRQFTEAKKKGENFFTTLLDFEEKNSFYKELLPHIKGLTKKARDFYMKCPGLAGSTVIQKDTGLYIENFSGIPYSDEENNTLMRFGKVFQQTYTRFLDLQKAEAQAREAQINLAVERVRAKALAMHKSEEIMDVVAKLKDEVMNLDIPDVVAATIFLKEGEDKVRMWDLSSLEKSEEGNEVPLDIIFKIKKTDPHLYVKRVWENPANYFVEIQDKKGFKRFMAWLREHNKNEVADEVVAYLETSKIKCLYHAAKKLNNGKLVLDLLDPPTAEIEPILTKMGTAFDLAYKRFEDLQKAEAQARESQIEAALERVRSRTMAMQQSTELSDTSALLFQQIQMLGISPWSCGFNIWEKENTVFTSYMGSPDGGILKGYKIPLTEEAAFIHFKESRDRGDKLFIDVLEGDALETHYRYFQTLPGIKEIFEKRAQAGFPIPTFQIHHLANFSHGNLMFITYEHCPEAHDIFIRFAKVFEQTYTRFLDLQKSEAQAREAQIESALERVRSKTMAMHNSQDVGATVGAMFDELVKLGIEKSVRCGIGILDHTKPMELWTASSNKDGEVMLNIGFLDMSLHPLLKGVKNAWKKKMTNFTYELQGKDLLKYFTALNESPDYLFHVDLASLPKKTIHNSFLFSEGTLFAFSPHPLTEEEEQIFKRFSGVFAQTYTRYLDLLKAEAQAREAEIEAALERVRSQTMAMHNSKDVGKTVVTFFDEVMKLGLNKGIRCGIGILEDREKMETWSATSYPNGDVDLQVGLLDMKRHPLIKGLEIAWKNKEEGYNYELIGEDVVRYYEQLIEEPDYPFHVDLDNLSDIEYHRSFFFSSGIIFTFTKTPISEEAALVLNRFASVFGQTYRRFLDLQKAEAQAREARIEAALEKVRARTMAMQSSNELQEAANVLFLEIQALGIKAWSAGYNILSDDRTTSTCWMSSEGELQDPFPLYYTEEASFIEMGKFLKSKEEFFVQELAGKDLVQHYDYMKSLPELKNTFKHIEDAGLTLPAYQINHLCKFSQGYLLFITYESVPEAHDIFKRFTKVFEQTYTRFLDLQKAENQSKESQIELALERVRASTMAMHKSEQLAGTAQVLFEQFDLLGVIPDRISIAIFNENKRIFELWATDQSGTFVNHVHDFSIDEPTCMAKTYQAWKEGKETFIVDLKGDELKDWVRFVKEEAKMELDESKFKGRRVQHSAFFSQGYLLLSSHLPIEDEMMQLLLRFAKVFQQTFTRFLDLQKAETQAREAIKRASVDRVRAEIASMRTTTDLNRITPLVWSELTTLNVPFIRCGVFIMDEEQQQVQTHLSTPDGKAIASFNLPFENTEPLTELLPYWRKKEMYTDHWDESAFIESTKILMQRGAIASSEKYITEKQPTNLHLHFLPFLQGMLYVGSEVPLSEDELNLAQNLAEAFSTAYSRYEDFNKLELANKKIEKTLVDLKQTQTQLIQSEKMASLGELTAGIAHEIQNPLNFVNNFSEVSHELMKEMLEELERGDIDEAKEISHDIEQNLEKINHHGKRASDIVKGMLQHSRKGDGKKDLTDINKLADEYLRLAYHGLRAKDKSFNADFIENFEKDLPLIQAIPQDIGRVLLNLISNAFYAVSAKDKEGVAGFKPTVVVSTKKINHLIEIRVKDNGSGVSEGIRDKVFQPFFTTKPTGQGTGLGLSMSYDIVTKGHGGSLDFTSTEGEGTEFIIQLPLKK